MNLNAKWTIFSALAIAALGAGALAVGCSSSDNGTGNQTTDNGSNTGPGDKGDTGTCGIVDPTSQLTDAACRACLLQSQDCVYLQSCANAIYVSSGKPDCLNYWGCLEQCDEGPDEDYSDCAETCVANVNNDDVTDANSGTYLSLYYAATNGDCKSVCATWFPVP
ncbi:MAG: hypothetical protein FWD73_08520 [Polyangiaceae bacterium]|nr:hypothetical protein [Polyangiaceae bacterium]